MTPDVGEEALQGGDLAFFLGQGEAEALDGGGLLGAEGLTLPAGGVGGVEVRQEPSCRTDGSVLPGDAHATASSPVTATRR